jgi:hypothetical protein
MRGYFDRSQSRHQMSNLETGQQNYYSRDASRTRHFLPNPDSPTQTHQSRREYKQTAYSANHEPLVLKLNCTRSIRHREEGTRQYSTLHDPRQQSGNLTSGAHTQRKCINNDLVQSQWSDSTNRGSHHSHNKSILSDTFELSCLAFQIQKIQKISTSNLYLGLKNIITEMIQEQKIYIYCMQ